uniref:FHA domain-containing protein n=1 Tax=Mola mola TaxID=94237 RepID=A0A3Q4A8Y8_MOLML
TSVSRIHAELHAEKEASGGDAAPQEEGWRVHINDRSSHGTWVNEVRLQPGVQWELSDSDTLTFGGQGAPGSPEFYFLFQKVKVRPLDFDAITVPKVIFVPLLPTRGTNQDRKMAANLDLSKLSFNRATVILNSIGSLSKMKGSGTTSDPGSSSSRRKSAHTVLLEDDSSDEPRNNLGQVELMIDPSSSPSSSSSSLHSKRRGQDKEAGGGAVEPCAAPRCQLPQQDTVQWIQCDVCDAWYHIDCLHIDRKKLLKDPNADFHCG